MGLPESKIKIEVVRPDSSYLTLQSYSDLYAMRILYEVCRGNSSEAARVLGVGRATMYRIKKRVELNQG